MKKIKKFVLATLISVAFLSPAIAQHDLNGYWQDNYGMHYYVRHVGNTIYWFGEHKDGIWAGAFKGTISNNTQRAILGNQPIRINGNVYDLPKGKASTQADLGLRVISASEMRKTSGPFSPTVFRKKVKPRTLPGIRSAGFTRNGLDGLWTCNDGGTYYMRQIGNKVIWFGEKITRSTTNFSNVGIGTRSGNIVNLTWADVPKGRALGRGSLQLRVNGPTITKTSGGGFGGSRWNKANKKELSLVALKTILEGYTSKIKVHLNSYAESGGSPRWYKADDAYVELPDEWGGKYEVDIPEVTQERRFRNYHYYVNDLNSSRYGITTEIKPMSSGFSQRRSGDIQKKPMIQIAIRLETDGTEIIGRCTSCPSSDKGAPDVHISAQNERFPIIYVKIPLTVRSGNITYDEIHTNFDANIQAGGLCRIADRLCEKVTNYRTIIRDEINKGFQSSFNDPTVRRNFENSLKLVVPRDIQGSVSKLSIEGTNLVIEYN